MNTEERRQKILETLIDSKTPLTGTVLANKFQVSRQIIVGDITVLRATGHDIYATPRGYIIPNKPQNCNMLETICCRHANDKDSVKKEFEIIVDNGGKVHDVIVEHPLYGEIRVNLFIATRREAYAFIKKMQQTKAEPLLVMTNGVQKFIDELLFVYITLSNFILLNQVYPVFAVQLLFQLQFLHAFCNPV